MFEHALADADHAKRKGGRSRQFTSTKRTARIDPHRPANQSTNRLKNQGLVAVSPWSSSRRWARAILARKVSYSASLSLGRSFRTWSRGEGGLMMPAAMAAA